MKTQIIFLVEIHFSEWHWHRLGIDTLKARGFDVTILDCTRWIVPDYYETFKSKIFDCPERIEIGSREYLERSILRINTDCIIAFDNLGYNTITSNIRQKVYGEIKALRAVFNLSVLPQPAELNLVDSLRNLTSKTNLPIRAINLLKRLFATRKLGPPDIAMLSGKISDIGVYATAHQKIWCHAFDYDDFLKGNNIESDKEYVDKYAVYLYENIVLGPDSLHCGIKAVTTAEKIYPCLNQFFSEIEAKLGLPVVIAAHPKSNYSADSNVFEGRQIIKGHSAELVRASTLVLGHTSASLNFPMFCRKPILIMTSDDIEKSRLNHYVRARAAETGKEAFNIDQQTWNLNINDILSVDENRYREYLDKYIKTPGSPSKPVWEIFSDYVEENIL